MKRMTLQGVPEEQSLRLWLIQIASLKCCRCSFRVCLILYIDVRSLVSDGDGGKNIYKNVVDDVRLQDASAKKKTNNLTTTIQRRGNVYIYISIYSFAMRMIYR